ncbi:MAG: lipoprotein releasing system transrane protein LolC [Chitinophagaceae bacterium]|nr:lipoprotein releasing system transrane protein LolC [Chitinophagaceae bacterium]
MNLLFAWRYFKSKKSTNAINIIAWISVVAIAVGTAALIIVLSVFNGFEGLVKSLYGDFYSDIKLTAAQGKICRLTKEQIEQIRKVEGVAGISLIAEEKALLKNQDAQSIIFLKGVDDQYPTVNKVNTHIVAGRGKYYTGTLDEPSVVIGAGIESAVSVDPSTNAYPLTVYLPNRKATNLRTEDALFSDNINVSGTFTVQQEFDNKYAFTNLAFMKYMLDMQPDEYTGAEIGTTGPGVIDDVKDRLQALLGNAYKVETLYEQNQSLYTVMQMEKWVIYGILCLILVVAAFNMIGALTMLVLEKQKDIAVLKAMGADREYIQSIFLSEGFVLACVGGISGILIAAAICYIQMEYKVIKLTGGTFIIDYYPVKMIPSDFVLVAATVFFVSMLAAWVPSRKAAGQDISLKS